MIRTSIAIASLAVGLAACSSGYSMPNTAAAPYNPAVGVTGTASDAASNVSGSTSTSMEEQRIKRANGNTAPTVYTNDTHVAS